MKPFNSIFAGVSGRGSTAIGLMAIMAVAAIVITIVVTNDGNRSAEANSPGAPVAQVPQDPVSGNSVFMQITANGDDITGESIFGDRFGAWGDVLEYNHSATSSGPRIGGASTTGRTTHNAIVITKPIDKSSPLLFEALNTNQTIEATLEFERHNPDEGFLEVYYIVEIDGARITGIRKNAGLLGGDTETISIAYGTMMETNHLFGTSYEASAFSTQ